MHWYHSFETIECQTPSRNDDVDFETEARYRKEGARFIMELGNKLGLRYLTMATGIVFYHRFYMFHSFKEFSRWVTSATCLFLAGKVEETPKKCRDILKFAQQTLTDNQFKTFGENPREELMICERILLQTIKFDLQTSHPYEFLIKYGKSLKGEKAKINEFVQKAWIFINDSLSTPLCLVYKPQVVALAVLLMAFKLSNQNIREFMHKARVDWWKSFFPEVTGNDLEEICKDLMNMYEGKPPRRRFPNKHLTTAKSTDSLTNSPQPVVQANSSPQPPDSPLAKRQKIATPTTTAALAIDEVTSLVTTTATISTTDVTATTESTTVISNNVQVKADEKEVKPDDKEADQTEGVTDEKDSSIPTESSITNTSQDESNLVLDSIQKSGNEATAKVEDIQEPAAGIVQSDPSLSSIPPLLPSTPVSKVIPIIPSLTPTTPISKGIPIIPSHMLSTPITKEAPIVSAPLTNIMQTNLVENKPELELPPPLLIGDVRNSLLPPVSTPTPNQINTSFQSQYQQQQQANQFQPQQQQQQNLPSQQHHHLQSQQHQQQTQQHQLQPQQNMPQHQHNQFDQHQQHNLQSQHQPNQYDQQQQHALYQQAGNQATTNQQLQSQYSAHHNPMQQQQQQLHLSQGQNLQQQQQLSQSIAAHALAQAQGHQQTQQYHQHQTNLHQAQPPNNQISQPYLPAGIQANQPSAHTIPAPILDHMSSFFQSSQPAAFSSYTPQKQQIPQQQQQQQQFSPFNQGTPHQVTPHQGTPHQGTPHQGTPHQGTPQRHQQQQQQQQNNFQQQTPTPLKSFMNMPQQRNPYRDQALQNNQQNFNNYPASGGQLHMMQQQQHDVRQSQPNTPQGGRGGGMRPPLMQRFQRAPWP